MKYKVFFIGIFLFLLLNSCSDYSYLADDDVYVLNSSTIAPGIENDDETSYNNFKNNKKKDNKQIFYGSAPSTHIFLDFVPRNNYPFNHSYNDPRYYGNYWNPYYSNCFNCPYYYDNFYNYNYYGMYNSWYYPNSYYSYYPYSYYDYPYYSPYNYQNNNSNNIYTTSYNTHYKARNSVSGQFYGRRVEVNSSTGFAGITKKERTNKFNNADRFSTSSPNTRTISENSNKERYRPIERGVGVSGNRTVTRTQRIENVNRKFEAGNSVPSRNNDKILISSPSNNSNVRNPRNTGGNSTSNPSRRR